MTSRKSNDRPTGRKRPPAKTPEGRENQLIAKAIDLAEKQIEEGTASAQVITHYLKLGSMREQLEREKLREEIRFRKANTEAMASQSNMEELYTKALSAMREYKGEEADSDYDY